MKIRTILNRQGVYDPVLERELIDAINTGQLVVPPHSIPLNPEETEEQEWLDQLNFGSSIMTKAA